MVLVECTAKRWGSSIGIVIPRKVIEDQHISENEKILVDVRKKRLGKEFFGILQDWKRPTEDIVKEMRKGWR